MFRTHSSNLRPEERQRLHPDFLENERAYCEMRDQLLARYAGQWVAIHKRQVVSAGTDVFAVMDAAWQTGGHPYIALVGAEDKPVIKIRREEFAYDSGYWPAALPLITVTFLNHQATRSQVFGKVIADTGADVSVLPDRDCEAFDLFSSPALPIIASGIAGPGRPALIYRGKADINGFRTSALTQSLAGATDRIVGRDVLNHHRVVFDGPQQRVMFEP
jgi:Family of unknown function (DUF5678)